MSRKTLLIAFIAIFIVGLTVRLSHINFGVPLTYFIDEMDHSDPAIKYALGYKTAIQNHDFNFFKPNSYVYGSFPTYFLSLSLVLFNKITSLFKLGFNQADYIIVMRIGTTCISMLIPIATGYVYYLLFKDKKGLLLSVFLTTLNWKLIEHSIYINQDTFLAFSVILSYLFLLLSLNYKDTNKSSLLIFLSGAAFGLAFGTKITALVSLPIFGLLFVLRKNWKGLLLFGFGALMSYIITNPFSVIAFSNFSSRLIEMGYREGGVVFGSVDLNPFKYIIDLNHMLTLPILLISVYGAYLSYKLADKRFFHVFLITNVFAYLIFFSLESRNSERYLLPTLPVLIIYASYGIAYLYNHLKINKYLTYTFLVLVASYYLYFPISLFLQLTHNKPRVDAYYWMKQQISGSKTLVYTEDGRDPLSMIKGTDVTLFSVYVSHGAQYVTPKDPMQYEYVVLSSKPMEDFKRDYVVKTYPEYSNNWKAFEKLVTTSGKFSLVKEFKTTNLNLLYFSDVSIYKKN